MSIMPLHRKPAVSEKRLSLLSNGKVRYELKTPYRDGATHVIRADGLRSLLCILRPRY